MCGSISEQTLLHYYKNIQHFKSLQSMVDGWWLTLETTRHMWSHAKSLNSCLYNSIYQVRKNNFDLDFGILNRFADHWNHKCHLVGFTRQSSRFCSGTQCVALDLHHIWFICTFFSLNTAVWFSCTAQYVKHFTIKPNKLIVEQNL